MSCVGYVWQLLQRQQQPMATMLAQQQYALAQQQQQMGRDQCLDSSFILYCSPPHFCRNLFESHSAHYLFKCFPVQMLRCRKEICIVYFVCLCLKLWPKMSTQLNLYLWVCCTGISHASKPSQICVFKRKKLMLDREWIYLIYTYISICMRFLWPYVPFLRCVAVMFRITVVLVYEKWYCVNVLSARLNSYSGGFSSVCFCLACFVCLLSL